jgi:hypothetical protein
MPSASSTAPLPLHAAVAKALAAYLAATLDEDLLDEYPIRRDLDRDDLVPPVIVVAATDDGPHTAAVEPRNISLEVRVFSSTSDDPDTHFEVCRAIELLLSDLPSLQAFTNSGSARPVDGMHIYFMDPDVVRHDRRDEIDETILAASIIAQALPVVP